jgi:hypothetical protein
MPASSPWVYSERISSWTNADDGLARAPLGRVEDADGFVEGRDPADVRPQPPVPHPLNDLTQLGTIGFDNEVDCQAIGGPRLGRPNDGHQRSSGANKASRPLADVAADDIEHQIDSADIFQRILVEVEEFVRAETQTGASRRVRIFMTANVPRRSLNSRNCWKNQPLSHILHPR